MLNNVSTPCPACSGNLARCLLKRHKSKVKNKRNCNFYQLSGFCSFFAAIIKVSALFHQLCRVWGLSDSTPVSPTPVSEKKWVNADFYLNEVHIIETKVLLIVGCGR